MAGTLYLVSTPIGNLEDITLRALRILAEVDLIACEDTRRTRKLLSHFRISKSLVSMHDYNERGMIPKILARLEEDANIALVSDAGTPLISDPGFMLVREALTRGVPVVALPGPSALITALVSSGLPVNEFVFLGFLPARSGARRSRLAELATLSSTAILYEAPHRLTQTLEDAVEVLGPERPAVVARELTKIHEELIRGTLAEVREKVDAKPVRGEIVLLIGPDERRRSGAEEGLADEVSRLIEVEGVQRNEAIRRAARLRGITRSEAYRLFEESKKTKDDEKKDGADERT